MESGLDCMQIWYAICHAPLTVWWFRCANVLSARIFRLPRVHNCEIYCKALVDLSKSKSFENSYNLSKQLALLQMFLDYHKSEITLQILCGQTI